MSDSQITYQSDSQQAEMVEVTIRYLTNHYFDGSRGFRDCKVRLDSNHPQFEQILRGTAKKWLRGYLAFNFRAIIFLPSGQRVSVYRNPQTSSPQTFLWEYMAPIKPFVFAAEEWEH